MAVLYGNYESTIDAKRRLAIPASIRERINSDLDGTNFVVILGKDRHLWMYPEKYFDKLAKKIKQSSPAGEQNMAGMIFALARLLKPDGQGRVVLPDELVRKANVPNDVMLVCKKDRVEIWSAEEWTKHEEQNNQAYYDRCPDLLIEAADRLDDADEEI